MAAFESMSKVAEIADLHTNEVMRDGRAITIRPKTGASTWLKLTKRLTTCKVLNVAGRMAHYREKAKRQENVHFFMGRKESPQKRQQLRLG